MILTALKIYFIVSAILTPVVLLFFKGANRNRRLEVSRPIKQWHARRAIALGWRVVG